MKTLVIALLMLVAIQELTVGAPADSRRELRSQLRGTMWQWDGGAGEVIAFNDDGYVEQKGWDERGLITRWEVIDERTVLLRIERGRQYDLYAVLTFTADITSYAGFNFHGSRLSDSTQLRKGGVLREEPERETPVLPSPGRNADSFSNGLVAFYPFNGNANDESGNDYHADVHGAILCVDRYGNAAAAYTLDGNDHLVNDTCAVESLAALSVCAWIKTTNNTPSYDGYAVLAGAGAVVYMSRKSKSPTSPQLGCIMAALDGSSIDNEDADFAPVSVNDGMWHFIAAVNDGGTTQLYVDGQLDAAYEEKVGSRLAGITLGRIASGRAYWIGAIDDVRVYSRALSPAEIQGLWNKVDSQGQAKAGRNAK